MGASLAVLLLTIGCNSLLGIDGIETNQVVIDASVQVEDASTPIDATSVLGAWTPVEVNTLTIDNLAVGVSPTGFALFAQAGNTLHVSNLSDDLEFTNSEMANTVLIDLTRPLRTARVLTETAGGLQLDGLAYTAPTFTSNSTVSAAFRGDIVDLIGETTEEFFTTFRCSPDCLNSGGTLIALAAHDIDDFGGAVVSALSDQPAADERMLLHARGSGGDLFCSLGFGSSPSVSGSNNLGLLAWYDETTNSVALSRVEVNDIQTLCTGSVKLNVPNSSAPIGLAEVAPYDFVSAFVVGSSIRVVRVALSTTPGTPPTISTLTEITGAPTHIAVATKSSGLAVVTWSEGGVLYAARGPLTGP